MKHVETESFGLKKMLADYMENGFLENIVDMFKHDKTLYKYVGDLLIDERMRVRIGVAALLETLKNEDPENVTRAIPYITPVLKNKNPVYRGDAIYVLGLIGNQEVIPILKQVTADEDKYVRQIAEETIEEIKSRLQ